MTKTFRGELVTDKGEWVGMIHATNGGFIIRQPKPFASGYGPVAFDGRVFKGAEFQKVGATNIGYAVVKRYRLKEAA